jgi:hypothetical protein
VTLAGGGVGSGEAWPDVSVVAGRVSTGSGVCAERDINEALGRVCKEIVMRAPFFEKKVNVFFAELPFSQDAFFCVKPDHPGSASGRAECEQLKR